MIPCVRVPLSAFLACVIVAGLSGSAVDAPATETAVRSDRPELQQLKQRIRHFRVQAGPSQRTLNLGTSSPYYGMQIQGGAPDGQKGAFPRTFIEVDRVNADLASYFLSTEMHLNPTWADDSTVRIDVKEKSRFVNFRFSTAEKIISAQWQVSRLPFPNDPARWQNQYVPGLVAWGPVTDVHTAGGFHYFRINFARVAARQPGSAAYFEGAVPAAGPQTPAASTKQNIPPPAKEPKPFPRLQKLIAAKKQITAPQTKAPPTVEFQRQQQLIVPRDISRSPALPPFLAALIHDQTFYVRVIPILAGGKGGIPAVPVQVTVRRPYECPIVTSDITVKPPSAEIVWYMRPNFFDSYGDAHDRWYAVMKSTFTPKGLHMYTPPKPEELAWWEKVIAVFKSILNYFSDMMTGLSVAWNELQNKLVEFNALVLSYTLTGGAVRCDKIPECKSVLKTGLQATMAAFGIPPTLPTGPELMNLSTDYLIKLGADEFGAGALYDAYQAMPDDAKKAMMGAATKTSSELVKGMNNSVDGQIKKSLCQKIPVPMQPNKTVEYCTTNIPDPIFNSIHPATVMVYVRNPAQNGQQVTDRVVLTVTDSMRLYSPGTAVIPPLKPGDGIAVPVVLREDIRQFLDINGGKCPTKDVVTVSGETPCPLQAWYDHFFQGGEAYQNPPRDDVFTVTFSAAFGSTTLSGLDAQSSGKNLGTVLKLDPDAKGGACPIQHHVRYPAGWHIATIGRNIVPEKWDNLFSGPGPEGNPTGGLLRTTPH